MPSRASRASSSSASGPRQASVRAGRGRWGRGRARNDGRSRRRALTPPLTPGTLAPRRAVALTPALARLGRRRDHGGRGLRLARGHRWHDHGRRLGVALGLRLRRRFRHGGRRRQLARVAHLHRERRSAAADDRHAGDQLRGRPRAEQLGQQRRRGADRQRRDERLERARALLEVTAEARAVRARTQVRANPATAHDAAVAVAQHPPDVVALHLTPLAATEERGAGLEDRLLDRAGREFEHDADLGVAEAVELAQDERGALAIRQVGEVHLQQPQLLALGDPVLEGMLVGHVGELVGRPPAAQDRDRLVVGDPEQPRAQLEVAPLLLQRREGAREGALQRVLRVLLVAQDRAAVAVQRLVMAFVGRRERDRVATGRA